MYRQMRDRGGRQAPVRTRYLRSAVDCARHWRTRVWAEVIEIKIGRRSAVDSAAIRALVGVEIPNRPPVSGQLE